jgi:hypothetical protein
LNFQTSNQSQRSTTKSKSSITIHPDLLISTSEAQISSVRSKSPKANETNLNIRQNSKASTKNSNSTAESEVVSGIVSEKEESKSNKDDSGHEDTSWTTFEMILYVVFFFLLVILTAVVAILLFSQELAKTIGLR